MTAQPEGPVLDEAARKKVVRVLYVYRDMVEGFMMDDLNVERLGIAIAALQHARETMLAHGIDLVPRRW